MRDSRRARKRDTRRRIRMLFAFLLLAAALVLGPGQAEAQEKHYFFNILYAGFYDLTGSFDEPQKTAHDTLCTAFGEGYAAETREIRQEATRKYFSTVLDEAEGKDLQDNFKCRFLKIRMDGRPVDGAHANGSFGRGEIPVNSLGLAFFTLNDLVFLEDKTSTDLRRLAVYILCSFYIFDFNLQNIIYARQMVLPIETKCDAQPSDGKCYNSLFGNNVRKGLQGFLLANAQKALKSKGLKNILALREKGELRHPAKMAKHCAAIRVKDVSVFTANVALKAELNSEDKFKALAGHLLTIYFGDQAVMMPSIALGAPEDDQYRQRLERVFEPIANSDIVKPIIQRKVQIGRGGSDTRPDASLASADTVFINKLFPLPGYEIRADIKLRQENARVRNELINTDRFSIVCAFSAFRTGEPKGPLCPTRGNPSRTQPRIDFDMESTYVAKGSATMGEAKFFNALVHMIIENMKRKDKVRLFGEDSYYGPIMETEVAPCQ